MSKNAPDPRKFDVRLIQRNIKNRSVSIKDVQNHLGSLPDVAAKATTLGAVEDERAAKLAAQTPTEPSSVG